MSSEEKAKRKILIFVAIILVIIALLAFILSAINKKEKPTVTPTENPNYNINTEITLLKNEQTIFGIQKILNDYFDLLSSNDTSIIELLDKDFINENSLTTNNILTRLNSLHNLNLTENNNLEDHENILYASYSPKEIYYNPKSSTTYYFVKGLIEGNKVNDSYFLIIVTNNKYVIRPLNNINNILEYATKYKIEYKIIDNDNNFTLSNTSEENKLSTYINEFTNMLYLDINRAYNMLYDKKMYNYSYLENNRDNLYEKLSIRILSFGSEDLKEYKKYTIEDYNDNMIYIYEYSPLNFKIDFRLSETN